MLWDQRPSKAMSLPAEGPAGCPAGSSVEEWTLREDAQSVKSTGSRGSKASAKLARSETSSQRPGRREQAREASRESRKSGKLPATRAVTPRLSPPT